MRRRPSRPRDVRTGARISENAARGALVEPLADVVFGPFRPAFYLLLGAVALVLLVASVNVASLLIARGSARMHEVAVRDALGARSSRLVRLFLVESLVMTALATLLGLASPSAW